MAEIGLLLAGLGTAGAGAGAAAAAGAGAGAAAAGTGAALGGLGTAALTAGLGGAAAAGASALLAQSPTAQDLPSLSLAAKAPTEQSPAILNATRRQVAMLGTNGRDSTNLSRRKRKSDSVLDDAGDGSDTVPAYTGTTLG